MSPKLLLVYVAGKASGWLGYEDGVYRFHYSSSRVDQTPVSRLMPCSRTFYESPSLFPVFAQHLPVGANRDWLINFLNIQHEAIEAQSMSLLAASGYNGIGHCGFVNADAPALKPRYTVNPQQLLNSTSSREIFMDWRNKYGEQGLGVGGGGEDTMLYLLLNTKPAWPVPNVLAILPTQGGDAALQGIQKRAQHLSLMKDAGVLCPAYQWSNDGQVLLIERHDLNENGQRLPVESLASLCGVSNYSPSQKPMPLNVEYLLAERVLKVFSVRFSHDVKLLNWLKLLPEVRPLRDLCFVGDQLAVTILGC